MICTDLSSNWEFKLVQDDSFPRSQIPKSSWLPATVPGSIHLDLLAAGLICDPFKDRFEAGLGWVDSSDWQYRTTFEWHRNSQFPKNVLRFEGLDTVASVFLNGSLVGQSNNYFQPLEIDVADLLEEGLNELRVEFASAVRVGEERRKMYFEQNGIDWQTGWFDERAFVRKPGYMFGWDWGPRLVGCGIVGAVKLLQYSARLLDFRVVREPLSGGKYRLKTETQMEGESPFTVSFEGSANAEKDLDLVIDAPELWWPNGYGEQRLYKAAVTLADGQTIAKSVGFSKIELLREPDSYGQSFEFAVNGRKIWSRGANWIPDDSFPARITTQRYREQVRTCCELNMNMLRVWGGGLYESEAFYDACDRNGILVWQDFPYACSYYPDDAAACDEAKTEAEFQIKRLRDRTCLALWCGNNENLMMWEQKWGGTSAPSRYYGENIYNAVLKDAVAALDLHHAYIESSPISNGPHDKERNPNADGFGDQHYWAVWHGKGDWTFYKESGGRFASEFGFASSCSMAQWGSTLTGGTDVSKYNPLVRWHDKTNKDFSLYSGYVDLHYPESHTLKDWVYYSQLNQRDALRFGIEHFRSSPSCAGALIWQINDCWPVESWAVQDYAGFIKPAGFELARLYAPFLITLKVDGDLATASLISDSETSASIEMAVYSTTDGRLLDRKQSQPGDAVFNIFGYDKLRTVVCFSVAGSPETSRWSLLCEPKEVECSEPKFHAVGDSEVQLAIEGLVYDLIVCDADDPANMPVHAAGTGAMAQTLVNEGATYRFEQAPKRLNVRCLWGEKTVTVVNPSTNGKVEHEGLSTAAVSHLG